MRTKQIKDILDKQNLLLNFGVNTPAGKIGPIWKPGKEFQPSIDEPLISLGAAAK